MPPEPPSQPPSQPPGPPPPPPLGPRPSGPPEVLQQGDGQQAARPGLSSQRKVVLGAGALVGAGAVTAAVWGAMWYFGTGPQPAEALPDSTIAYVSIDIDPSGQQILAAKDVVEKFPAWNDLEISSRDDLRQALFDEVLADAPCDLDYGDDIEPWIGDRAAAALVDQGDRPTPVVVLQVKDADRAEEAFDKVNDCGPSDIAGWAITGDWAVLAETEDIARRVAEDAEDDPLSGDDDYDRWTDEVGDPGILNVYLAPEAGELLAEHGAELFGLGTDLGVALSDAPEEVPDEVADLLDDFEGGALTLRFDDGALELEAASSTEALGGGVPASDNAGDSIETLPQDTAAALAYSFEEGWFDELLGSVEGMFGFGFDLRGLLAGAEDELGLDLPEDAETLTGESAVIAVGGDLDLHGLVTEFDVDLTELPVGIKIKGDADAIQDVIDKLLDGTGVPDDERRLFVSDSSGDFVAIGPDEDYRDQLLDDGNLGGSGTFRDVVRETDAGAILYVNLDAGDWLDDLVGDDGDLADNLAPLEAGGMSVWEDDGVGHAVLRITTE